MTPPFDGHLTWYAWEVTGSTNAVPMLSSFVVNMLPSQTTNLCQCLRCDKGIGFLCVFFRYSWWSPQWLPCEINVRKKLLIDRFSTLARNHFKIVEFWISELPKHHETFRNLKRVPCFGQAQTQQIQQANVSDLPRFRCSSRIPETWPNLEAFIDDGSPANLSSTFNHSAIVL